MLIDHTFNVNRSREEVFDYFANVENVPEALLSDRKTGRRLPGSLV